MLLIEYWRGDGTSTGLAFAQRYGVALFADAFEFGAKFAFRNDGRIGECFEPRRGEVTIDLFGAEPCEECFR